MMYITVRLVMMATGLVRYNIDCECPKELM